MATYGNLILTDPQGGQTMVSLDKPTLTFGRAPDNDLQLNDAQVADYHGRLECDERGCLLVDLAHTGGTLVNGAPVERTALGPNDVIQLNGYHITYVAPAPAATIPAAPVPVPPAVPIVPRTHEPDQEPTRRGWLIGLLVLIVLLLVVIAGFLFGERIGLDLPRIPLLAGSPDPSLEYVLDASYRMTLENDGQPRIEAAKSAIMSNMSGQSLPDVYAGFRVFGNGQGGGGCEDTALLNNLETGNGAPIVGSLNTLYVAQQDGPSPLTEAILAGIADLSTMRGPGILVVVTGGPDTCWGNSDQLIQQALTEAGADMQVIMIGYQTDLDDAEALKDMAGVLPAVTYLEAQDPTTLNDTLKGITDAVPARAAASWLWATAVGRAAATAMAMRVAARPPAARCRRPCAATGCSKAARSANRPLLHVSTWAKNGWKVASNTS